MGEKLLIPDAPAADLDRAVSLGLRWSWRSFLAGALVAWLVPLAIAWMWGPRSKVDYEDPLTGRTKQTATWLGITLFDRIEENDVSKWADGNSISGSYPAQYGWSPVTSEHSGWFTGSAIACGGHGIPGRIQRGEIAVEGLTPEATLRKYQAELAA